MRLKGEKAEICYEETKEFFKKRACKYNPENPYSVTMYQDEHKELVTERNRKEIEILYPWLGIGKSSRILDVACGIGRWADAVQEDIDLYYGIDFCSELVDIANKRNKRPNFHFFSCDLDHVAREMNGHKFNLVLMIGIIVYINDVELNGVLNSIESLCEEHATVCVREPIASDQRLTLKRYYSEELKDDYNAIYRSKEELIGAFETTFLAKGFHIAEERALFEEADLNNRKETHQHYFILKR